MDNFLTNNKHNYDIIEKGGNYNWYFKVCLQEHQRCIGLTCKPYLNCKVYILQIETVLNESGTARNTYIFKKLLYYYIEFSLCLYNSDLRLILEYILIY